MRKAIYVCVADGEDAKARAWAEILRGMKFSVATGYEVVEKLDKEHDGYKSDVESGFMKPPALSVADYQAEKIRMLSKCDVLVIASSNWKNSRKCQAEVSFAKACDVHVYTSPGDFISSRAESIITQYQKEEA